VEATEQRASAQGPPRVVTIGMQRELKAFANFTAAAAGGGQPGAGNRRVAQIVHNYLAVEANDGLRPQLAFELPSTEKGTWTLNPDGTMTTTWRLRPNVRWHDGTPFTAEDLVFGVTLVQEPSFPMAPALTTRLITSTAAPDALTFVVHRSTVSIAGADPLDLDPMPRHLLEELYRTDRAAIVNSPLLSSEFIGLGPYRIESWAPGVEVQLKRFDDYYQGRPKLDRVIIRYIGDPNTMLANAMAGTIDVALQGLDVDAGVEIKQRWEGTGNRVIMALSGSTNFLRPQFRPELAQPRNGAPNLLVRRAMQHATDRQAIVEASSQGLAPIADSWVSPENAWRSLLESAIPQYPYDPARAQLLLSETGWVRGGDGVLVHQPSGERFESRISARPAPGADRTLAVIADGWKQVGAQIGVEVLSPALAADRQVMGSQPFAIMSNHPPTLRPLFLPPMHSSMLATDANRWAGRNFQGYSNPRVDAIIDRLEMSIEERRQIEVHRELLQEAMSDVAIMPLFWLIEPVLMQRGVKGVTASETWNIFEWDKAL
jgi:peptide/nickel transport system substrate-binding protein